MFCSTQISVWVQLFNDKPYPRGMTVECEYEVSKRRAIHHTTHTYKIPADASRTLIIPRVLMVEKPQYGTGLVRCRHHALDGIGRWSKYKMFEVVQHYLE
jgi:hypothetical protein